MRLRTASIYAFTIIWNLALVLVALLVLFHTYPSEDTAIVVALLVMLYGMTIASVSGEGAVSAMYFLQLAKLLRHGVAESDEGSNDEEDRETEARFLSYLRDDVSLETAAQADLPILGIHVAFSLILALIAGVKLLITLLS